MVDRARERVFRALEHRRRKFATSQTRRTSSSSSVNMGEASIPPLYKTIPPSPSQVQSFLQRHLSLLLQERQAEVEESHLLLSSVSPRVLERNGLALCRLGMLNTSVGMGGKSLVELHRPAAYHTETNLPAHSFRSGDVVAIVDEAEGSGSGGSKKGKGKSAVAGESSDIDGVVTRVTDTKIVVAIGSRRRGAGGGAADADSGLPTRCRVVKVANEVTWERMEKNLMRLATKLGVPVRTSRGIRGGGGGKTDDLDASSSDEEEDGAAARKSKNNTNAAAAATPLPPAPSVLSPVPRLIGALLALDPPQSPPIASLAPPPLPLFNPNLNPSQTQALSRALASRDIHLIHGPPGTGKTTVLVELILQLVIGKGERVLVAGSSNLAVDNLAAKLLEYRKGRESNLKPVRVGHPARILTSLQSHTLDHLSTNSSSGQLLSDVRRELAAAYASLYTSKDASGASAGNKSTSRRGTSSLNNKRVTGSDRKKLWEEVRALKAELRRRECGLFTDTIQDANVVLSTLHGASGGVLERSLRRQKAADDTAKQPRRFDTVIVDEACQALEASIWGALLDKFEEEGGEACRVILAGDDKQLGPVVKSESNAAMEVRAKTKDKKNKKGSEKKSEVAGRATDDVQEHLSSLQINAEDGAASDAECDADADVDSPQTPSRTLRPPRSLSLTLFSRLLSIYGPGLKSLLTIQYRMNNAIMAYPNEAMYDGQLVAHDSCADSWVGDGRLMGWQGGGNESDLDDIKGGRVVFFDTAGSESYEDAPASEEDQVERSLKMSADSKSNAHEVDIIAKHLQETLFPAGIPPSAITLLAPYNAQISLLSSTLSATLPPDVFAQLEIGTIDALQGREKDVVVISLTRSNEQGEVGFLREHRRLNVAMTRAKRMLVVVGDSETVGKGGEYLRNWMDWLDQNAVVEPVLPN